MSDVEPPTGRRATGEPADATAKLPSASSASDPAATVPADALPAQPLPAQPFPAATPTAATVAAGLPFGAPVPTAAAAADASRAPVADTVPPGSVPPGTFPAGLLSASPAPQEPIALPPQPAPRGRLTRLQFWLIIGASVLIFVLLATGAVFFGINVGRNAPIAATTTGEGTSPQRVVPGTQVQPTAIPTCSLDTLASKSSLMKLSGSVYDTATGAPIYSLEDSTGVRAANQVKILTAAAAIAVLGPTYQITTSVDMGSAPGTVVLVGQGDATLSRVAAGTSVYAGAPTLASLASKTLAAYNAIPANSGVPIANIVLDSTYWNPSNDWDSSVPTSRRTGGYLSDSTALQVDGDRANPRLQVSPRSNDPVTAAGNAFASALGLAAGSYTLTKAAAPSGASQLASVQSQPVSVLVKQMLRQNDSTLAEMLARITSVKENLGGGPASISGAVTQGLGKYNVDTSDVTVHDGSGESDESLVPPLFMSTFMSLISQKANGLSYVAAGLPVSAESGTLASHFTGDNAVVKGKITGMAGSLPNADTLTGYLTAADGTGESFAFFAEGDGITSKANAELDSLATAVYKCGKNITNN